MCSDEYLSWISLYLNSEWARERNNSFQREDSEFFFMKVFVKLTNPVIRPFKVITPNFIVEPLIPLYVAWFFFMFRFYFMPWILGYHVMGMLSFPLESEIALELLKLKHFLLGN